MLEICRKKFYEKNKNCTNLNQKIKKLRPETKVTKRKRNFSEVKYGSQNDVIKILFS